MISAKTKLFGFVKNGDEWKRYHNWNIPKEEAEFRIWKHKHKDRIHASKNESSPLIHFKPSYGTFSFNPGRGNDHGGNSSPTTFSHILRQQVLSEMPEIHFKGRKILNHKARLSKELDFTVIVDAVYVEKRVYNEENTDHRSPDLIIEFSEPVHLALKWKGKLFVEVVETNEVKGDKIEFLKQFGHPIIEIPPSEHFDTLKNKGVHEIDIEQLRELNRKIKNFFKKSVLADFIYNPTSEEFNDKVINSAHAIRCGKLEEQYDEATKTISRLEEDKEFLKGELHTAQHDAQKYHGRLKKVVQLIERLKEDNEALTSKISKWNAKSFFGKLLKGFKV